MKRTLFFGLIIAVVIIGGTYFFNIQIPMKKAEKEILVLIEENGDLDLIKSKQMSWNIKSVHYYMNVIYKDEQNLEYEYIYNTFTNKVTLEYIKDRNNLNNIVYSGKHGEIPEELR